MMKAKRMAPMEIMGGHGVKDLSGLQKMIKKAQDIEAERLEANSK
ncbi:MAG: heterodisulfide reductase, partial [Gammaproteobacteria bacterium]|nr:heterodisulfide reductase [Gammaproteobacteria bacterium]